MKLTQLEIQGFKSFADRVKLHFDAGITGIVGPNGCGKSNVIDAIRWVLGEQKTRNLRSDKMENVIFNGTDKRRKASLAEVTMTLENDRGVLPTEYHTVTITRRLYRDGDSEYLLNGVPCRLKDISTLLMDTGIGSDSYAIIELGAVEELLTDRNNSRRQLFEEAAGISKYKLRKKETLSRLDDTQTSLLRVEDLLSEIEKQMRSLERQAKRAAEYLDIKQSYRKVSAQYALRRLSSFQETLADIAAQETILGDQLTAVQARIAQADATIEELQAEMMSRETTATAARSRLAEHVAQIQRIENDHALRSERLKFLLSRKAQIEAALGSEGDQRTAFQQRLEALEGQIDTANEQADEQEHLTSTLETELDELRTAVKLKTQAADELAGQVRGTERQTQDVQRIHERNAIQIQGLQNELQRTQQESSARAQAVDDYAHKLKRLQADALGMEAEAHRLTQARDQHIQSLQTAQADLNRLREQQYQRQRHLDMRQQEYTMTKGLVDSLEGFSESVKFLKKHSGWSKQATLVSEAFYAPDDVKLALEAVLEPYLLHVVVATRAEAAAGLQLLKDSSKGRAQFIVLDELPHTQAPHPHPLSQGERGALPLPLGEGWGEGTGAASSALTPTSVGALLALLPATPLIQLTETSADLQPLANLLLANTFLVDQLPPAQDVPEGVTLVERSGAVLSKRGSLAGGSIGLFEGQRIGRAKNLEKLGPEIQSLQDEVAAITAQVQAVAAQVAELQGQNPGQQLDIHTREWQRVQRELSILQAKDDEYQGYLSRMRSRGGDIEGEIARLEAEQAQTAPRLHQLQDSLTTQQDQLQRLQRELGQRQGQLSELTQRHNTETLRLAEAKNRVGSLKQDFRHTREQLQGFDTQRDRLQVELAQIAADAEALTTSTADYNSHILALYDTKRELTETVNTQEERVTFIRNSIFQQENALREARREREDIHTRHTTLKDKGTEIRIQQNSLTERLQVEFELDLARLKPDEVFERPAAEYILTDLEKDMMSLRERLHKFGEVNPTAIEAYQEVKERHDFITAQQRDLAEARANLLATMDEMDRTALAQFNTTFDAIRSNFQRVFRTLFTDQDTCDISLVNTDDPLESPIEITARPKGKRPLTINQLSGGEKTLTAISLLFAIYLVKPAPFCIFDEVDAPLDDANVDKFTNIIREFSVGSQFVIVTHNKRTMAKTNVMYGVTMEETGVSRVLPVDLVALKLN